MPELHNDTPQMWTYYHFLRSTVTDPFIFQFTLICHSIINLQNSLFQVICISLKFCCMDKLCILVLFNLSKSFLKLFNHLTNLTIVSDNANFVLFLHLLNEMVLLLSPMFVGDQMLSSWEGLFFTINTFTAHIFPAVTICVQIRQHSTNLFHSRCP